MKQLIKKESYTIFDDYDMSEIHKIITKKVECGEIKECCVDVIKTHRHFIYEYC